VGRSWRVVDRSLRWEACEQAAEIVQVRTFLKLEVKVLFGEVEVGEPVLIHEFDDSTDFLEVHGKESWSSVRIRGCPAGRASFEEARRTGETASSGNAGRSRARPVSSWWGGGSEWAI
jgi:hypothetical protein